ncbi:MAG: LamG domain-containing protein, partial [Planctomycetes bacterium]|nr:LamG domain-containing protein [Planctomycetota bacterium]
MKPCSLGVLVSAIALSGCIHQLPAESQPAVAYWTFDGDLRDQSGRGNDANAQGPQFVAGYRGQGLKCGRSPTLVPDSAELRLAPGLCIECWVKLDAPLPDGQPILVKDGEYMLRVDPAGEGGHFAFFVYLAGWEPRARSKEPPKVGEWYHLIARWDGNEISLAVNGNEVRGPRTGSSVPTEQPLRLAFSGGVIDELRIENPNANHTAATAHWSFDGDLHDGSGKGHDVAAEGVSFGPGRCGQALRCDAEQVQVPSRPDLQLAPGLRLDCSVRFAQVPTECRYIAIKEGEYQLRLNSQKEGGQFAFFVNLDGRWEPRVSSTERVKAGVWYRIVAKWDGLAVTLDVNGEKERAVRSGSPRPGDNPLGIGVIGGLIDELRIDNPRLPVLRVRGLAQEHAILRAGRAEKLTAIVQNLGTEAGNTVAGLELPPGVTCLGASVHELGSLPPGTTRTIDMTVQADTAVSVAAGVRLTADG